MLVQAIQNHPQTQELVQVSSEGMPEQEVQSTGEAQVTAGNSSAEGITSVKDLQLSSAKRLALMYRSQKKMLLWDVVLSLQG